MKTKHDFNNESGVGGRMRSMIRSVLFVGLLASSANAANETTLWRDLSLGDNPETVAAKLGRMSEIKRIRVAPAKPGKEPKVSVSYKDDGIAILDDKFQIALQFTHGALSRVALQTGETCENDSSGRFFRLINVLKSKYPLPVLDGQKDLAESDLVQSRLNLSNGLNGERTIAYANADTAVAVTITYSHTSPPAVTYATGLAGALNNLSWSIYNSRAASCGGTGADRAVIRIVYMTSADMQHLLSDIEKSNQQENEDAASKL
jgi:hypothetical protein